MRSSLEPVHYTNLTLGKQYIIKVREDFFNQEESNEKTILIVGTFDTFECFTEDAEEQGDAYQILRDRIYTGIRAEPMFIKGNRESFNEGVEETIRQLVSKYSEEKNLCFGTFVNVRQIDKENSIDTVSVITKDWITLSALGYGITRQFIFYTEGGELQPGFNFFNVSDTTSVGLISWAVRSARRPLPSEENIGVELPKDLIDHTAQFGGKTKNNKKHNLKSRKQKRKKINKKKSRRPKHI